MSDTFEGVSHHAKARTRSLVPGSFDAMEAPDRSRFGKDADRQEASLAERKRIAKALKGRKRR